ncbi:MULTISPECIES: BON domain-containing protein [Acidobacteriaceae]|uniref:BON domain-containing protein n=1 Tax=Acidobacteriaceae TaxID=204434 RepID=UPI00131B5B2D|nr:MULTISPECIES: BON domain-containing protein [Acidobacteriaceae]MDW5264205.1 BON domain-containing protein [Edaphobacter sp.]
MSHAVSFPRAVTFAAVFAVALSLGGCKKSTPPPDDAALTSAVQTRIAGDSALQSESIQATVQDGSATLNGTVSSEAARSLAASDAAQVAGLKTVINNLAVQQAAAQQPAPQAAEVAPPPPARVRKEQVKKKTRPEPVAHSPAPIERVPPPEQAQAEPPPSPPPPPPAKPAAPAFRDVNIPAGTTLPIRITQTLDSASTQQGDSFSGTVASDVVIDGVVVIPNGAAVSGRVDAVQEAAHFKGNSLLTIELTGLRHRGDGVALSTEPYSVAGKGRGKNTAIKTGGGAAVGAILGGIFGGGKGAAIGAAAGGGVGAGSNAITRGEQVQIPSESLIRFHLTNTISLRVSNNSARNASDSPDNPNLQQRPDSQQQ